MTLRALFAGLLVAAFVVTAKWLLGPVDLDPVVCGCMAAAGAAVGETLSELVPERSAT